MGSRKPNFGEVPKKIKTTQKRLDKRAVPKKTEPAWNFVPVAYDLWIAASPQFYILCNVDFQQRTKDGRYVATNVSYHPSMGDLIIAITERITKEKIIDGDVRSLSDLLNCYKQLVRHAYEFFLMATERAVKSEMEDGPAVYRVDEVNPENKRSFLDYYERLDDLEFKLSYFEKMINLIGTKTMDLSELIYKSITYEVEEKDE